MNYLSYCQFSYIICYDNKSYRNSMKGGMIMNWRFLAIIFDDK